MSITIRNRIQREEFDHQTLLDVLQNYSRPRDKITALLRDGVIIRVKKGLYIFGKEYRQGYYSPELLANFIYGPSYLSLEFALHYYGMIPEQVHALTSVTIGRSRRFSTPIGLFTYRRISVAAFRVGMTRVARDDGTAYLIATPEKALADKIRHDRGIGVRNRAQMITYLSDNLRIDESVMMELDENLISEIGSRYRSRRIRLLAEVVHQIKGYSRLVVIVVQRFL